MEEVPFLPLKRVSRHSSTRRMGSMIMASQLPPQPVYQKNDIKMLALLCLLNSFEARKQEIEQQWQQRAHENDRRNNSEMGRVSSTLTLEPLPRSLVNANEAASVLGKISCAIRNHFVSGIRRESARNSRKMSIFNLQLPAIDSIKVQPPQAESLQKTSRFSQASSIHRQDILPKSAQKPEQMRSYLRMHKKLRSELISYQNSPSKQASFLSSSPKHNFSMVKKQEVTFLKKMAIKFKSNHQQARALTESINLFAKNLSHTNYYLRTIDRDKQKCEQIVIYLKQLQIIFDKVFDKCKEISKMHQNLKLYLQKQPIPVKTQLNKCNPEVFEHYVRSDLIFNTLKNFSLTPNFTAMMAKSGNLPIKLASLLVQARYTLKYMEKQIQKATAVKGQPRKTPKWHKAYMAKFMPRNI